MTTRIELIFPDLDETLASTVVDAIAGTLANDEGLKLLMAHTGMPRRFEVQLNDSALPNINGQTYEVTNGVPGDIRMTNLGGGVVSVQPWETIGSPVVPIRRLYLAW